MGAEEAAGVGRTILIVDDALINRKLLERQFEGEYTVLQAKDGVEALEIMRARAVDVVLLDIAMPRMDGFGVMRAMKRDARLSLIPVIAITISDDRERLKLALDCGAQDAITKPFDPELIRCRVANILTLRNALMTIRRNEHRHDGLTGLMNRAAFVEEAQARIREKPAGSFVVSCLDIDCFKVINDQFGHAAGDVLLKYVAKMRMDETRRMDGLTCRDMADTFFSLMPNDPQRLDESAQHLFRGLKNYELPIGIQAHIGRYVVDEPELDVNLMLDRALLAVRSIKGSAEKNIALFTGDMRAALLHRQELQSEMRPALASGQFVLFFQPQFNFATGAMTGAEVLVRWNHPKKGVIPPGDFVPLFEKNGFISQLDLFVWEQACACQRRWMDAGLQTVPISVNISRHDIHTLDLKRIIPELVKKYHLSPAQLHLEITESIYLDHPQELIKTVTELQSLGFTVEMDDFGAGYSSLNLLKDVPVDVLKLDMKFLTESGSSARGGSILSAVVRMAHWLKLPVIAEGVETRQQAEYLKSIGCCLMQGYYFHRPMPAEEQFRELLKTKALADTQYKAVGTDIQGAADFFDASTQTTLLFNSFVGGAAIAEYDGTTFELLRMNDRFFEVIGYSREEYLRTGIDLLPYLYPTSREACLAALNQAVQSGGESECEMHFCPILDGRSEFWTMSRIRFLAQNAEGFVFYLAVENITERRQLQRKAEKLSDELSGIISSVPCGIVKLLSADGVLRMEYASEGLGKMLGDAPETIVTSYNQWPGNYIHPDDLQWIARLSAQAVASSSPFAAQYRVKRRDGQYIWVNAVYSFSANANGARWIYCSITDTTSIKQSEQEKTELANELSSLLQSNPCGIYRCTLTGNGRITHVSDSLLQMLGYTQQEFFEQFHGSGFELACAADRPLREKTYAALLEQDAFEPCEYRIRTKDGSLKWVLETARKVTQVDGTPVFSAVVLDIDARKLLEKKLLDEVNRAEALIANTPGGVLTLSVTGGVSRYEFISDGFCRLLGLSREEAQRQLNDNASGLVHPEDCAHLNEAVARATATRTEFSVDYRLRHSDGRYIWVNLTANPVVGDHGVERFYCSFTDITAHVRQEADIRIENERNRLYIQQNRLAIFNYEYAGDTLWLERAQPDSGYEKMQYSGLYASICESGRVESASARTLSQLMDTLRIAPAVGTIDFRADLWHKGLRWCRMNYSCITDDHGKVQRIVGLIRDVEEEKERERLLHQLTSRSENTFPTYEPHLVADIFTFMNTEKDTNAAISHVLGAVGEYYHVSRVYIFENSEDNERCSNTYEWCAEGIEPQRELLQNLSYAESFGENFYDNFDDNGQFRCPNIEELPADQREFLAAQGIQAMLQSTIQYDGRFAGFIGFDDCHSHRDWTCEQTGTLSILSSILSLSLFRKRDRENALLSEDFLASLDENTDYISVVDAQSYELIYGNKAYRAAFGELQPHTICYAQTMSASVHCAECPISAYQKNQKTVPVEFRRPDGVWLLAKSSPLHMKGREAYLNTYLDITQQKNLEESLRERLDELAAVIRQSGKKVFRYNINDDSAQGILEDGFLGMEQPAAHCLELLDRLGIFLPGSREIMEDFYQKMAAGEPSGACDVCLRGRSGVACWYHADFTMIEKDGAPDHAVVSFYDMTMKMELYHSLSQSEDALKRQLYYIGIANSILPTAIVLCAVHDAQPVTFLGGTLFHRMGYHDEEIKAFFRSDFVGFICEENRPACLAALQRAVKENVEIADVEFRAFQKDGSRCWLRASIARTQDVDASPAVLLNVVDIGALKTAEEKQRAMAEENAIVIRQSGKVVLRYDINTDRAVNLIDSFELLGIPNEVEHYKAALIDSGIVLPESMETAREWFREMRAGNAEGSVQLHLRLANGSDGWFHVDYSMLYDEAHTPSHAIISLVNITQQRQLEMLQAQLRTLTNAVPGGILLYEYEYSRKRMSLRFFNNEICRISGYSREDYQVMTEARPFMLVYGEDEKMINRLFKEVFDGGRTAIECEYRMTTKRGLRWMQLVGRVIESNDKTALVYVVLIDITDRKNTEAQLLFRSDCLNLVDEALSAGTIINTLGMNGPMLYISANIEELIGYTTQEVRKMYRDSYRQLIHPDDYERVRSLSLQYAQERPQSYEMEFRFVRQDGTVFWVMEKATYLPDFQGQPAYLSVFVDISKQIAAIRENKQLLKIVAKHSQKYLAMYDFSTNEIQPLDNSINVEENALELLRSPQEYFDSGIVAPESLPVMRACFSSMREGAPDTTARFRAKAISGRWIWMECTISTVFDDEGKPTYAIASFADITDSYEKELAFQRYQELIHTPGSNQLFFLDYNLTQDTLEANGGSLTDPSLTEVAKKGFAASIAEIAKSYVFTPDVAGFRETFSKARLLQAFSGGITHGEMDLRVRTRDHDEPVYVRSSYQMVSDPYTSNIRLLFVCQLIDSEKRAELALLTRAQTDAVTGILNRATFVERVRTHLSIADDNLVYGFAMLDVDHFKSVNDLLGHVGGDRVLHGIARTVQSLLIRNDMVGRLGGDEFGLFFCGYPDEKTMTEKLAIITNAIVREVGGLTITASIGVALFRENGRQFEDLYEKADIALYQVKATGRNRYLFYSPEMSQKKNETMLSPIDAADGRPGNSR